MHPYAFAQYWAHCVAQSSLSCTRDKSPNVWFAHNGERLGSFDGHNGAVFSLDVDFDTRWLLTASADQTAKLWDIERGSKLFTFGAIQKKNFLNTTSSWNADKRRLSINLSEQEKRKNI
jgi:WD40 repeat protein